MSVQERLMIDWQPIETAPDGQEVRTIIIDGGGFRNEANLVRKGRLWFLPDMSVYVYYCPTHWQPTTDKS